jgi:PLD-like domain
MPAKEHDDRAARFLAELYPLAGQAARVLNYLSNLPETLSKSDQELAARIGQVSAQHVAIVIRALVAAGFATRREFSAQLTIGQECLTRFSWNLQGVSTYLRSHKDSDTVRLVLTEPGIESALRREINRRGLPPRLFQTRDAFLNLAHAATSTLTVLAPFIDDTGSEFLIDVFSACKPSVRKEIICRPLSEPHCGVAFRKRKEDFHRLAVHVYEYALTSTLPSGRETFHAKVVLVDDTAFYVGSSNFMGSALDRSLECGVIVHGQNAKDLHNVVEALKAVATLTDASSW